jgi:CheY-like chemotaxis protein
MDGKLNILLVDDQRGKLLTYEAILRELDENLISARSGMEALQQLLKNDIAVVLMDVSMPGMDGYETARMIHQHPRFQNIPIIFGVGNSRHRDRSVERLRTRRRRLRPCASYSPVVTRQSQSVRRFASEDTAVGNLERPHEPIAR